MTITRREFLQRAAFAGSGLVLATFVPELANGQTPDGEWQPNAFLRITPDDRITVIVVRHEMGQGVRTLLPMMVAEELEADWSRVRIEQAVTGPEFDKIRLHTSGSGSSTSTFEAMRRTGATAREMLIAAAAQRWRVPAAECRAEAGSVVHAASRRRLRFGQLVTDAAKMPVPENPRLKDPASFKLLGTPVKRIDGPDIVTGRAQYGMDVRVPNMVFASIERAPVLGARIRTIDDAAARGAPGVIAVMPVRTGIQHGVAVVGTSTWAAMRARSALHIDWDLGEHREFDSDHFEKALDGWLARASFRVRKQGDAEAALASAARRHEASYVFPFQAHAPLEPMNCTADVRADRAEFWVPTQSQVRSMAQAVKVTGLPKEQIRIHATLLGGGFGRRLFADYLAEAAEISKALRRPVQVVWTREDDMRSGFFEPCTAQRLSGGLDAQGRLVALVHRSTSSDLTIYDIHEGRDLYGPRPATPKAADAYESDQSPWGAFDNPYDIANLHALTADVPSPVPYGPWRAVEYPPTVWGRESFIDELARLAGVDPLRFRLDLLTGGVREIGSHPVDPSRLAHVHRLAAERAGWDRPLAASDRLRGRGIAASVYHGGSYIAQVAEVSVAKDLSDLRVHRMVCAVDCGLVLNPLGVQGQAESGITWGLSYTLGGAVAFKQGRAVPGGYADFPVIRMNQMPVTEIHLVSSQAKPGGFGEHAVPMVAPAVANAVFDATGIRVRRLPITPQSLRAARRG
ncbi:MAG TPA: molybdopterin cofactor-binding domain-containing protein [Candidatus Eisenbacteria bacterium]|nr:molybdopterin cofactor-binding domain-containing protein [Candidatus Eisenbacteria bacterium]